MHFRSRYSVVVEPGAFVDSAGNAFPGTDGQGTSSCVETTCVYPDCETTTRDCSLQFAVLAPPPVLSADFDNVNISSSESLVLAFAEPTFLGRGT